MIRNIITSLMKPSRSTTFSNNSHSAQIFQIYYSEVTRQQLDPGFIPLDNKANTRPDWREFHPIHSHLSQATLDDSTYYGFFSPKFHQKTGLMADKVFSFIAEDTSADVIFFSPFCDMQSLFLNCFLQGEFIHPGLLPCMDGLIAQANLDLDLREVVMDSTNTIFCNYFVARPKFWREWLKLGEQVFLLAETQGPLYDDLNRVTDYGDGAQMKVFVIERLASLLLIQGNWTTRSFNPFNLSVSQIKPFCNLLDISIICDALKQAYRRHRYKAYITQFQTLIKNNQVPQTQTEASRREE